MERAYENNEENVYFACRKKAASYNEKLNSRESAAEMLGISASTLANHELGITKNVPVDTVVMMADLYHAPELKNRYCKYECPIGRFMPLATKVDTLQSIAIRVLESLDEEETKRIRKTLIRVAAHDKLTDADHTDLEETLASIDQMSLVFSELRLLAENLVGGESHAGTGGTAEKNHA